MASMMNVGTLGFAITVLMCVRGMSAAVTAVPPEISGQDTGLFYSETDGPTSSTSLEVADDSIVESDEARVMATSCGPSPYDRRDYCECDAGWGLYRVVSTHSNRNEDRKWTWYCRQIAASTEDCYWTGEYHNNYDEAVAFQCPAEYYMAGVDSVHSNSKEDRRFEFRCCKPTANKPRGFCQLTDYINNMDGAMDYTAPNGYVFTGMTSFHSNRYEDRRWNICIKPY